jgi:2,3-bisphosphoglycerate-dependent phosphoglycerate mutase
MALIFCVLPGGHQVNCLCPAAICYISPMPRLLLVRHAQSQNNVSSDEARQRFHGDAERIEAESERTREPDPELSEAGRKQAELLAEALAPRLRGHRTLLVSSPMRRALLTATPVANRAGLAREQFVCEADLFEVGGCYYGEVAQPSTTSAQLEAEFPVRCRGIGADGWYAGRTGPESNNEARERIDRVINWVEHTLASGEHDLVVVVGHGDLFTRWLRRWFQVPWSRGLAIVHANTGISNLTWSREHGALLESLNDVRHLPDALHTGIGDSWWNYAMPDLEIARYQGWSAIPAALADELAQLRRALHEPEGKSLHDYADSDARSVHFVAHAEGRVAGYVQFDPQTGRLRQLIVNTGHRGARLGRRLVAAVEAEARAQGCRELLVHGWVSSLGFYRALGFVERGSIVSGEGVDWQALEKKLS